MNDERLDTLGTCRPFSRTAAVDFAVAADERYDFIARSFGKRNTTGAP